MDEASHQHRALPLCLISAVKRQEYESIEIGTPLCKRIAFNQKPRHTFQMSAVEMTTDAALLDEMSSLLDSNSFVLAHTPREPSPYDNAFNASTFPINLDAPGVGCNGSSSPLGYYSAPTTTPQARQIDTSSSTPEDASDHKRKIRKEKEILRKQRYQQRLKSERETLRLMANELSSRLAVLQQARKRKKSSSPTTELTQAQSAWRQVARKERSQRRRSEGERQKLVDAVAVQANYLSTLRELLLNQAVDVGVPKLGIVSTEGVKEVTAQSTNFGL